MSVLNSRSALAGLAVPPALLQKITCNLRGTARLAEHEGKSMIVVEAVMLKQAVLSGSMGPLLYPAAEICKTAEAWNNRAVTVNHPAANGRPISARERPEQVVGFLQRCRCENRRLVGEVWVDRERAEKLSPGLVDRLLNHEPLEVSTGLYSVNEPAKGEYMGERYAAIATDLTPDHLALLPEQVGACSLQDGCGIFASKAFSDNAQPKPQPKEEKFPLVPPKIDWNEISAYTPKDQKPSEVADGPLVPPTMTFDRKLR